MGQQEAPGETEEAETATGAVNSPGLGRRSIGPPYLHLRRHHGWQIAVTFANCKQLLGLADAANRKPQAVVRTAPRALVLYSLVVVWFPRGGPLGLRFPDRPWYPHKEEPAFAALLSTLRRVSWEENVAPVLPQAGALTKSVRQLIEFVARSG